MNTINLVTVYYPITYNWRPCHIAVRVYQAVTPDYVTVIGTAFDEGTEQLFTDEQINVIHRLIRYRGTAKLEHGRIL